MVTALQVATITVLIRANQTKISIKSESPTEAFFFKKKGNWLLSYVCVAPCLKKKELAARIWSEATAGDSLARRRGVADAADTRHETTTRRRRRRNRRREVVRATRAFLPMSCRALH